MRRSAASLALILSAAMGLSIGVARAQESSSAPVPTLLPESAAAAAVPTDPLPPMPEEEGGGEVTSTLPPLTGEPTPNPLAIGPGGTVIPTVEELSLLKVMSDAELKALSAPYVRPNIRSLMFTPYQYALLLEAQRGFFINVTRAQLGVDEGVGQPIGEDPKMKVLTLRELSLGGIVYASDDDWTIYLNNNRVTPDSVPKEVMGLKVSKEFIDLLWHDRQTNKIFPVRLRANQRFNLDNRIFLPGRAG